MKYKKLGKLPPDTIEFFKEEILKRKIPDFKYQLIHFDHFLNDKFAAIFCNTELKIQYNPDKDRLVQKAFYSAPGHGYGIHRDGLSCQSALNIVVSCNPGDWVRWYDDQYIASISTVTAKTTANGASRDVDIIKYDTIPYTDELRTEIGDVYVLDVESYHSFKCSGPLPRIVVQTKFENFPTLPVIKQSLSKQSFINIIQ
jgi:hypothetical protein